MPADNEERKRKITEAHLLTHDLSQLSGMAREVSDIAEKAAGETQDAGKKAFLLSFAKRTAALHTEATGLWHEFQAEFNIPKSHKVS